MRIISGKARGAKLFAPDGVDTRPTLDRVREAIFSMLTGSVEGACVLDLFAGSGAMGLEALSRGAEHADFADISREACRCVEKNIEKTRLTDSSVARADFKSFLQSCAKKYDIIFLDPPYASEYYATAFELIKKNNLLADGGIIVAECDGAYELDTDGFEVCRQRRYGKAAVYILKSA